MKALVRTHSSSSLDDNFRTKAQRQLSKLANFRLHRSSSSSDLDMYRRNSYFSSSYSSTIRDPYCEKAFDDFNNECYRIAYGHLHPSITSNIERWGPRIEQLPSYDQFAAGYYGYTPALEPAYYVQPYPVASVTTQPYDYSYFSSRPYRSSRSPRTARYRQSSSSYNPETYYSRYSGWQYSEAVDHTGYQWDQVQWDGSQYSRRRRSYYS